MDSYGPLFFCLSIYFTWDVAQELAEQRISGEESSQSHIQYAEDRIDQECLSLDKMAMRDCIHEEIEASRDHSRAEQDLDAQQVMADFTRIMGWASVISHNLSSPERLENQNNGTKTAATANSLVIRQLRLSIKPWVDVTISDQFFEHGLGPDYSLRGYPDGGDPRRERLFAEVAIRNVGTQPLIITGVGMRIEPPDD